MLSSTSPNTDEHSKSQQKLCTKLDGQRAGTEYTNITRMKERWSQMASKWSYRSSLKKVFNRLLQEGLQHLHIGLIMVRLYTLHRRSAGVNALVLIRDTRWRDDRAVISSMEMDLTSGTQLAYTAPDMTLSIRDFRDHIQLVIQTHGYEGWQGGESNLLLSRSLIGRLSNTSHTNFRYNVQNVADHLASRGVRAIPGSQRTTTELRGRQWLVTPAVISQAQNPQVARIRARTDGSLSVRFAGYTTTTPEQEAIRGENDEEELEQEFINLLTLDDDWPYEDDPEFPEIYSDPEEFSENDETEQDDGPLLGKWFLAILKAEQTEPTVEMMEPINPYQWFAIEQLDNEDELVQMTFAEFNWLETVDAESEWFEEQALMMTCQWDESDEDEILSTVQFLSQLGAPANQDEDLLSLLAKGGGEDVSSPNSKTKWDEDLFETIYMIEEMEYPQFKNLKKKVETVLSTAESSLTRIPPEPIMGPAMYPPGSRQPQNLQIPEIKARLDNIRGGYARQMNERFNLPTAQANQGAILVSPEDIGLYSEVISRWESITLNLVNEKNWADNKSKVNYIENLLGETEKKTWIQWRMAFPTEYEELVNIADDPQNVISQIRQMFLLEDPTTGSTEEQDRAYNDLERLSCHNVKDLFDYINDYKILAAKSGRMFISPELSTKFFRKMPPIIGGEIEKAFAEKYPGNTVGVIPRIHFTYQYLTEQCKRVALQRSLKDLSFCSRIPVPGYYQKNKKYGLRKAKTYWGKPHDTHIRVFKRKHADKERKCKCFICGEEGHFARNCTRQKGNIARAAIVENLDLDDDWDVLSVDQNEPDSDAICSFSEGEGGTSHSLMAGINEVPYETAMMITSEEISWRVVTLVPQEIQNCGHQWEDNSPVAQEFMRCLFCKEQTNPRMRAHCSLCHLTVCPMCSRFNLERRLTIQRSNLQYDNKDTLINELIGYTNFLLAENQRLKERIEELEMGKDLDEMRDPTKGKTPEKQILEEADSDDEAIENHIQKRNGVVLRSSKSKQFLDTGATVCYVDQNAVPKEDLEPSAYPIQINGVNSSQIANQKLKGGMMAIEENRFRIPFTYAFPMEQRDGIQMLIGCNFIRAMQGGLRIEGQMVTFYKNVTTIATKVDAEVAASAAIEELELSELEYFEIQRITAYSCGEESQKFKERFRSLLERLREQGYIGENPLQHWENNRVKCKLDIINPDITIQDKPLKHVTPAMKEQFDKHVQALLKIGVIRPSKSRHRTMAMMVNSGGNGS
ncbi:polyprotein [Rhynchospora pubera]|uniref:Polyprotein n=1 Tax=Rhynchospora pubera TaxID=906938 RepID=A0AAV8FWE1_9POAL|nr:polyprotein [Rhynchospora pubera]